MALVFSLGVVLAGGLTAAQAGLGGVSGYSVRVALPASARQTELAGAPGTKPAMLPEIAASEPAAEAPPAPTGPLVAALPVPTTRPRAKVPGMIALSYSLAGGADAGDAIEVEKPVSIGGSDAGRIALRIDGNARVYALGSRLAAIIAAQSGESAVPSGLAQDFVSLEGLRALGIGVRYDAIRDRLVVDPPAA